MRSRGDLACVAFACLLAAPAVAHAGMPMIYVSELARMRVQAISFFLVGFLLSAGCIQLLWNYLRSDFPVLPRLSYGKALGVTVLWGLLFILVLTMISGARELMTPGAWVKQGATYQLAAPASTPNPERRHKLETLRSALMDYARAHDGRFPPDRESSGVTAETWQLPGPIGLRYVYAGPRKAEPPAPLVYEPELDGPERLVLLTSGEIKTMPIDEILRSRPTEAP